MKNLILLLAITLCLASCSSNKVSDHERFMAYETETLIRSESMLYTTTNTSSESYTMSVDEGLGVNAADNAVTYFNKSSYRFGVIGDSLLQFKINFNERGMATSATRNSKEYEIRRLLFFDGFAIQLRYEDDNGTESYTIQTTYN